MSWGKRMRFGQQRSPPPPGFVEGVGEKALTQTRRGGMGDDPRCRVELRSHLLRDVYMYLGVRVCTL